VNAVIFFVFLLIAIAHLTQAAWSSHVFALIETSLKLAIYFIRTEPARLFTRSEKDLLPEVKLPLIDV